MLLLIACVLQVDVDKELAADSILNAVDWEPSFAVLVLLLEKERADIDMNKPNQVACHVLPHADLQGLVLD